MHAVVLVAHAINLAERLGYTVRQEWIDGNDGGGCELRGRKYLFVNLAAPASDQLAMVLGVLRGEPGADAQPMPHELRAALRRRKIA
jgi:hypothetical protein